MPLENSSEEKPRSMANDSLTSLDAAAIYLKHHENIGEEGRVNSRALVRKIDWRIVPLAFACYTMQFIDKVNINVRTYIHKGYLCKLLNRRGFSMQQ